MLYYLLSICYTALALTFNTLNIVLEYEINAGRCISIRLYRRTIRKENTPASKKIVIMLTEMTSKQSIRSREGRGREGRGGVKG